MALFAFLGGLALYAGCFILKFGRFKVFWVAKMNTPHPFLPHQFTRNLLIMKSSFFVFYLTLLTTALCAQEKAGASRFPLTLTLFTESVSLPDFHNTFSPPNWGVRIGTEIPWRSSENGRLFQTFNVGYYRHKDLQQGLYFSSELGYRHFFGNLFADATLGGGYLRLVSELPQYESANEGFRKTSTAIGKFMPTLGLGLGYRIGEVSLFTRYEAFGEMPINHQGVPVLPHSALHLGARFQPSGK